MLNNKILRYIYWKSVELESFMAWVKDNEIFIILCMMQEGAELTLESQTPPAVGILKL